MALTADQKTQVIREILDHLGDAPIAFTKVDLRAAIDAADQWFTDNAAAYNTALPQPFRGSASAAMKAALLAFVATRRAGR